MIGRLLKRAGAATLAAAILLGCSPAPAVRAAETRSIYTNEVIPAAGADERPIAVMLPTDKIAQPSYGISYAKVLYEVMEEGNISRQLAIIDNWKDLQRIGNVRSCRLYYLPIATEWDPILVHFGGVYYMQSRIGQPDINNISGTSEYGTGGGAPGANAFFRTNDRKAPHNAYTSGPNLTRAAKELGYSLSVRPEYYNPKHFNFAAGVNSLRQYGNAAYDAANIDLSGVYPYTKSSFTYDPATGLYNKSIHGEPQKDGLNGAQLTFANVIIQNTKWSVLDEKGYLNFENLDSTEDGYYFTKGKCIHINWTKTAEYSPTMYFDDNGRQIELNEGKTYIGIAQKGTSISFY